MVRTVSLRTARLVPNRPGAPLPIGPVTHACREIPFFGAVPPVTNSTLCHQMHISSPQWTLGISHWKTRENAQALGLVGERGKIITGEIYCKAEAEQTDGRRDIIREKE